MKIQDKFESFIGNIRFANLFATLFVGDLGATTG